MLDSCLHCFLCKFPNVFFFFESIFQVTATLCKFCHEMLLVESMIKMYILYSDVLIKIRHICNVYKNSTGWLSDLILFFSRSAGCIFVEMLHGQPLFPDVSNIFDQLEKIWIVSTMVYLRNS